MRNPIKLSPCLSPLFITPDGFWFGYYNYDPLNYNQTKMLCHKTRYDATTITRGMTVEVGYFSLPEGEWHPFGVSDSYNWPQGAMLQWLPGKGNENKVVYNLSKDGNIIARIHDIKTNVDRDISWAIYGLTPDGKKSISIDMERAHWTRGYHYESVIKPELDVPVLKGDGVFEIDLDKNTRRLLISMESIIKTGYEPCFDEAKHWIEHIMISPSGKRFCFLHRFSPINNVLKYHTRLFVANIDGTNLQLIKGSDMFDWSHFGWDGDDAFSIYTYERSRSTNSKNRNSGFVSGNKSRKSDLRKLIKAIIPTRVKKEVRLVLMGQRQYYQYYKVDSHGMFTLNEVYKCRAFDIDGHQSFTKDGRYMIADSYPDPNQYQRIIVYDKKLHKAIVIGHIYAALHQKPGTCDLHPKLCKDNKYLMVDSAFDGNHHMILFKLNWEFIKRKFEKYGA